MNAAGLNQRGDQYQKYFQDIEDFSRVTRLGVSHVVTIGNFDGVHLGHLKIFRKVKLLSEKLRFPSVLLTFRPHPKAILQPQVNVNLLNNYLEKMDLLAKTGVDFIVEQPFSREFSSLSHEEFFLQVIITGLKAKVLVVGDDFAFGKGREGTLSYLKKCCRQKGLRLFVVKKLKLDKQFVSSSAIREYLCLGDIRKANAFLGRRFAYRGIVEKGVQRGRELGFPTANLTLETQAGAEQKIILPFGVYGTQVMCKSLWGDELKPGIANLGVRPTFVQSLGDTKNPVILEVHLFHFDGDLYGRCLEVQFVEKIRDERKFRGVEALRTQICKDLNQAKGILGLAQK